MKLKLCFAIILLPLFISVYNKANAQSPNWLWAKSIGGTSDDRSFSMAIDASGNVYTTGSFQGIVDFDPGSGTFNITAAPVGYLDIFISKLDSLGNFVWAKAMGGTLEAESKSIALDASNNVYTTGSFNETVDFDPGPGSYNIYAGSFDDAYISKLDSSGKFIWAKVIGGSGPARAYGTSIAVDHSGNIYTLGFFLGSNYFNPGPGIFNLTSGSLFDIFISKLDSDGNFVWARQIGGSGDAEGYSIALDSSGNIYSTGYFNGTVDFDPDSSGSFNLTSSGLEDIFILKLNSSGKFTWVKAIGGPGGDNEGKSIALDASGNIYTTGSFQGIVDFDPGPGTFDLTSSGIADIFISKLDSSGNFLWAKSMGGINKDAGNSIALDAFGNVYTTGSFAGTVDFDPGAGTFNLTSIGGENIFISKLDSSGNFVWANAVGGSEYDFGSSIVSHPPKDIYMTGYFQSPLISFGSTVLTNVDSTGSINDIFIVKLDNSITGIESKGHIDLISIYPNPASNQATIALPGINKKVNLSITDITGKIIYTTSVTETQKIKVNTDNFSEGVYFVQIQTPDIMATKKLVIVK